MENKPTKYRVKSLTLGGKGNKIFNSGDIVVEGNFPVGAVPTLIAKNFLEVYEEGTKSEAGATTSVTDEKFDKNGFDKEGFNKDGFDLGGFDKTGFNKDGLDKEGFDRDGLNKDGFNRKGEKPSAADANSSDKENMTGSIASTGTTSTHTTTVKIPNIDDVDVKDIKSDLKSAKIPANFLSSKETLYKLWIEHKLYIKK